MKFKFLLLASLSLLIACGAGSRETEDQQIEGKKWDEVMAQHDVVMPMMGQTHKVRKSLKAYKNTIEASEVTQMDRLNNLLTNLDKADEAMMDWMQGYQKLGVLQESKTHQEIMQYLEQEAVKINKVQDLMKASIEEGQAFIEEK